MCVYLRLLPPSPHSYSRCPDMLSTADFKCAHSRAFHNECSSNLPNGSRFSLNVPENNTGSCNY